MPKKEKGADPYKGYTKLKRIVTVRTRKFMTNKLLCRKQMVVDIAHQHCKTPSRALIRKKIAKEYKIKDGNCIVLFGFKSKYGGGRTTGFCLIYDNFKLRKRYDPRYRLIRDKLAKKKEGARKGKKEVKNRRKRLHGRKKKDAR
mmetsp:Transcript_22996/g.28238  ORF Transcript_22996/g.28238 Transcript_22996/m.28238 type:complete len:144 (-) Transcript_22996:74-505(-)